MSLNTTTDPALVELIQKWNEENTARDELVREAMQQLVNTKERMLECEYRLGNAEDELENTKKQLGNTQRQLHISEQRVTDLETKHEKEMLEVRSHLPNPDPKRVRFCAHHANNTTPLAYTVGERFQTTRHFYSKFQEAVRLSQEYAADEDQRMHQDTVNTMTAMLEPIEKKVNEMNTTNDPEIVEKIKALECFAGDLIAGRKVYESFEYYDEQVKTGRRSDDSNALKPMGMPAQSQPPPVQQNTPGPNEQYLPPPDDPWAWPSLPGPSSPPGEHMPPSPAGGGWPS